MKKELVLHVNGQDHTVLVDPQTPLLYVLRNQLGLTGVKQGCGQEQCGACNVLVDGEAVPSCHVKVGALSGSEIITIEGLGTPEVLHPLQEAFIEEQALQCGHCTSGMIVAAQGLLNKHRYPTNEQIRAELDDHLCRCGVYERIRRAIQLRIGRPEGALYKIVDAEGSEFLSAVQELPNTLFNTPDLDSWIRVDPSDTITVFSGKVEYGQGIKTALAQIAADELDVSLARINMVMGDTRQVPDEGMTVGSMSLQTSGNAIRYAAAEARRQLLNMAYEALEAPLENLAVEDGLVRDPGSGRSISYWELYGGKKFGVQVTGRTQPKNTRQYAVVGQAAKRLDLAGKVTGQHKFIQDLTSSELLHARLVRPPRYGASLVSGDVDAVAALPGVFKVVQDGSVLAVLAGDEAVAVAAADQLAASAVWQGGRELPEQAALFDWMQSQPVESHLVVDGVVVEEPIPPLEVPDGAVHTITAQYAKPFHMHASLSPSAAMAQFENGKLVVWQQGQGVFPQRAVIAQALGLDEEDIEVLHVEGAGCYGHNGADDAAFEAALLSLSAPGRVVLLKWSRADEHLWEPYSPAMVLKLQASLDNTGDILSWNHEVWGNAHFGRPRAEAGQSGLVSTWYRAEPLKQPIPRAGMWSHSGSHRNADPLYQFSNKRIVKHIVPDAPLRASSFRGLGAFGNIFAIESFMDELANKAGIDPITFRLRYLQDERGRAVLQALAGHTGWWEAGAEAPPDIGRGVAFARYKNNACYAAVAVEAWVERVTGAIRLQRAVIAADAGQIVNPDGLSNQLEGGFTQAASMTLKEAVQFSRQMVVSQDWESYPILRFSEAPTIETVLLNRPGAPFLGSGEASLGPTPAAIANAVFDAVSVRLREIPFTPEKVLAGLGDL